MITSYDNVVCRYAMMKQDWSKIDRAAFHQHWHTETKGNVTTDEVSAHAHYVFRTAFSFELGVESVDSHGEAHDSSSLCISHNSPTAKINVGRDQVLSGLTWLPPLSTRNVVQSVTSGPAWLSCQELLDEAAQSIGHTFDCWTFTAKKYNLFNFYHCHCKVHTVKKRLSNATC